MKFQPAYSPRFRPWCIVLLAMIAFVRPAEAQINKVLGQQLESAYASYRQALTQQDTNGWLKQTSRFRQMWLRNQVVSQGLSWPRAVFNLALKPPSFGGLKIIDASEQGAVARLTYYGKIDFGIPGESAPDNVLMVWFLKEGADWKYNTIQYANLNNDPELKVRIANGDRTFLQQDEFRMDPVYPPIPKPCEAPYHVARMRVVAVGCKATITMNGGNEEIFNQANATRVIIGGLRKGPNKISITATPTTGTDPAKARLEVEVVIPTGNPARPETSVFKWALEPGKTKLPHEGTIWGASKVSVQ